MFKSLLRAHTELLLNPFFEPSEGGGTESDALECYDEDEEEVSAGDSLAHHLGNQRYTDVLLGKLTDIANFFEKYL